MTMDKVMDFPDNRVIEEEASEWIVRFERNGRLEPAEVEELNAWIARSPRHRQILLRYASLWNEMDSLVELLVPVEAVRRTGAAKRGGRFGGWWRRLGDFSAGCAGKWMALPAMAMVLGVAVLLGAGVVGWPGAGHDRVLVTAVGEKTRHAMSDGSTLWLNTDSQVEVDYTAERRRVVLLRGEAYFQVAKNAERPFEVYAGNRKVRAVGTAFSVRRISDSVKVTVTEGKVELAAVLLDTSIRPASAMPERTGPGDQAVAVDQPKAPEEQVLGALVAGESVTLSHSDIADVEDIVVYGRDELARHLSWRDGLLVFAGEPLAEVVAEVSRYTSLRIDISDPALENMRIGGQFRIGETEALFDVLESGFGLQVSRLDAGRVEISSVH